MVEKIDVKAESTAPLDQVLLHVEKGNNFLLSGGAGSGKTYSLVEVIKQILEKYPHDKIACMTYTNSAVDEINDRVSNRNLNVSTIHDFLWGIIKGFQKELRIVLTELINDNKTGLRIRGIEKLDEGYYNENHVRVVYREFTRLKDGIISHDELLLVSEKLFATYPKIRDILIDKYRFILVDEYQDTDPLVVKIFLDYLYENTKPHVIGFFGDSMQSIYDNTIGNLNEYVIGEKPKVHEVLIPGNRRNPTSVINIANKIRTDKLLQKSEGERKGNAGTAFFYYSELDNTSKLKNLLEWNFEDSENVKELNLTKKLIANKAGFSTLHEIYKGDKILEYVSRLKSYFKNNAIEIDGEKQFDEVYREYTEVRPPTNGQQEYIGANGDLLKLALSQTWESISKTYVDIDQLLDDKKTDSEDETKKGSKRSPLVKHLFKIQDCIELYNQKKYNEFIQLTDFQLGSLKDKKFLADSIETFSTNKDISIGEVIDEATELGLVVFNDKFIDYIARYDYIYNRVRAVMYSEFIAVYQYLENHTVLSTQHKTKGQEYNNVLVHLDNGNWNQFNYHKMLANKGTESVLIRSQKLFYVCITRTKENLVVYSVAPEEETLIRARQLFGEENVINLDVN